MNPARNPARNPAMNPVMKHTRKPTAGGFRWLAATLIAIGCVSLTSCTSPRRLDRTDPAATLDQLARWMEGSFSNHLQAGRDPEFPETLLHVVRIWPTIEQGAWFYFEEIPTASASPIRQQIRHVSELSPGLFACEVYSLPANPAAWTGAWSQPARFSELSIDQLTAREGCTVMLTSGADGAYDGTTNGTSCRSEISAAAYATTRVRIHAQGIDVWEECFDEHGMPVGGPARPVVKGPLRFERLESSTAERVRSGGA
jgi:hypothetical protein